jgi:hypothetical protein
MSGKTIERLKTAFKTMAFLIPLMVLLFAAGYIGARSGLLLGVVRNIRDKVSRTAPRIKSAQIRSSGRLPA